MNAQEAIVRQPRLESAQGLANIVGDFGEMDAGQIVPRLDPVDLVGVEEKNLSVHLYADAILRCIQLADVLQ